MIVDVIDLVADKKMECDHPTAAAGQRQYQCYRARWDGARMMAGTTASETDELRGTREVAGNFDEVTNKYWKMTLAVDMYGRRSSRVFDHVCCWSSHGFSVVIRICVLSMAILRLISLSFGGFEHHGGFTDAARAEWNAGKYDMTLSLNMGRRSMPNLKTSSHSLGNRVVIRRYSAQRLACRGNLWCVHWSGKLHHGRVCVLRVRARDSALDMRRW